MRLILVLLAAFLLIGAASVYTAPQLESLSFCERFVIGGPFPVATYYGLPVSCIWSGGPSMELIYVPSPPGGADTFCQEYALEGPFRIAERYGELVSVEFWAKRETVKSSRRGHLSRTMSGLATFYSEPGCAGLPFEQYAFRSNENWYDPFSPTSWPVRWWAPGVQQLEFSLWIDTVGEFTAEKRGSRWSWSSSIFDDSSEPQGDTWLVNY